MSKRFYIKIALFLMLFPTTIHLKEVQSSKTSTKIDTEKISPLLNDIQNLIENNSTSVDKELLEEIMTIVDDIKNCIS